MYKRPNQPGYAAPQELTLIPKPDSDDIRFRNNTWKLGKPKWMNDDTVKVVRDVPNKPVQMIPPGVGSRSLPQPALGPLKNVFVDAHWSKDYSKGTSIPFTPLTRNVLEQHTINDTPKYGAPQYNRPTNTFINKGPLGMQGSTGGNPYATPHSTGPQWRSR